MEFSPHLITVIFDWSNTLNLIIFGSKSSKMKTPFCISLKMTYLVRIANIAGQQFVMKTQSMARCSTPMRANRRPSVAVQRVKNQDRILHSYQSSYPY